MPATRRHLLALGLALLGLAPACDRGASEAEAKRAELEAAKAREQAAREAEAAGRERAEADRELERARLEALAAGERAKQAEQDASCPSGEWCGTTTLAEQFAGEPTPNQPNQPDALGCPSRLEPKPALERSDGHPPERMTRALLDAKASEAARAEGNTQACCYDWSGC